MPVADTNPPMPYWMHIVRLFRSTRPVPTTAEESLDKLRVMMQAAADDNGSTYYLFTEDVKREGRTWIPYAMCEEDLTSWHRANWVMRVSPHRAVEVR